MKALTIWQPWASLVMIGAKPFEFRRWDYRTRAPSLEGQRIVIHAGARPVKPAEILDLIKRCKANDSSLIPEIALPLLERIMDARKCRGMVELSAALGTAIIGTPELIKAEFKTPDSDRLDQHMWAWPMIKPKPFPAPIPMNGAQGFWNAQIKDAA